MQVRPVKSGVPNVKIDLLNFYRTAMFPKLPPVLETAPSFGNWYRFWKLPPVLETAPSFGNWYRFRKLPPV
jgi:hypothetical protein